MITAIGNFTIAISRLKDKKKEKRKSNDKQLESK